MNLHEIPSIPITPTSTPLDIGITTRVMAKRQEMQRKRDQQEGYKFTNETERRRRSSKFMTGTKMPNSVIKLDAYYALNPHKVEEEKRQELEEFVDKLIQRLQPKSSFSSKYSFEDHIHTLKSKENTQKSSNAIPILRAPNSASKENKRSVSISIPKQNINKTSTIGTNDRWQELREKRKITRSTSVLAPLSEEKRPTYNSVKKAIDSSKMIQQFLDVDHVQEQKMKQIQSGKSLGGSTSSVSKENVNKNLTSSSSNSEIEKVKSAAKRRSSSKTRRTSNTATKKHSLKKKMLVNNKKSSK